MTLTHLLPRFPSVGRAAARGALPLSLLVPLAAGCVDVNASNGSGAGKTDASVPRDAAVIASSDGGAPRPDPATPGPLPGTDGGAPTPDSAVPPAVDAGPGSAVDAGPPVSGDVGGIPRSTIFSAITDANAQALCRWRNEAEKSGAPTVAERCTFIAASSTSSASACRSQVSSCKLTAGISGTSSTDCSTIRADGIDESCGPISLGEYADCVLASYAAERARMQAATCDAAGSFEPTAEIRPPACASLADHCQVLLP